MSNKKRPLSPECCFHGVNTKVELLLNLQSYRKKKMEILEVKKNFNSRIMLSLRY